MMASRSPVQSGRTRHLFARFVLGDTLLHADAYAEAEAMFSDVASTAPRGRRFNGLAGLAEALAYEGRHREARPDHRLASGVWSRSALPADVSHRSPTRARRVHPLSQEISRGPRRAPARSRPAPSGRSTTCSARGITVTASRRGCVARSSPPGPNSIARSTPNGCWARSRSPRSAGTKPSLRSSGPGSAASAHALGTHSFQLPHE
jgi:hypothetical protein